MNETDVREIVVRPLLERLGYKHGTKANIRTEVPLRYGRAFLGRKNPKRDPSLAGRADYVCDAIPYGRWVIEVKKPAQAITVDDVQQAHTYAAHPEISAAYFLITNGRDWDLYRTSSLQDPILRWSFADQESVMLRLFNLVGPEAIKRLVSLMKPDPGKPLGPNLASEIELIGGHVVYEDHQSSHPLLDTSQLNGLSLPITGGYVRRTEDGRIHAHVKVASAMALMKELSDAMGVDGYDFFSADEYVSDDPEEPTILQNIVEMITPAGTSVSFPPFGAFPTPFESRIVAYTEAVGFVREGVFSGTMRLSYDAQFTKMAPQIRLQLEQVVGSFPSSATMEGAGKFEIRTRSAI